MSQLPHHPTLEPETTESGKVVSGKRIRGTGSGTAYCTRRHGACEGVLACGEYEGGG